MNATLRSLSIVIPAFDEAQRLPTSLGRVLSWLDEVGADAEVIVVDDGSRDATLEVARGLAQAEPRLKVVTLGTNRGKGAAVRLGVETSTRDYVLLCDADLSTPIEEVLHLAEAIDGGADIAIGSRDVADSRIERHQPWYREAMGRTFNRIVQAVAMPGIRDTQCGFKLFRSEAASRCFSRMTIERFAFDVEVLYIARRLGYTIAEVGVRWINDERTTVDPIRDASRMLLDVVRIRYRQRGVGSDLG